jgi:hypothetical protein
MTDSEWDIDVPEETPVPSGPKALRDAYEAQKAEAAQLKKDLAALNAKVRSQEVTQKLTSRGMPEKAIGLFPKDVDPTDEMVSKWVEEYGSLFSTGVSQETPSEEKPADAPSQETPTKVDADQFKQMQQVTSGGTSGGSKQTFEAMLANPNLENEVPFEAFLEAMRSQGAKT